MKKEPQEIRTKTQPRINDQTEISTFFTFLRTTKSVLRFSDQRNRETERGIAAMVLCLVVSQRKGSLFIERIRVERRPSGVTARIPEWTPAVQWTDWQFSPLSQQLSPIYCVTDKSQNHREEREKTPSISLTRVGAMAIWVDGAGNLYYSPDVKEIIRT